MRRRPAGDLPDPVPFRLPANVRSYSLTPRQEFVVSLLFQGYSNKEIAERSGISEQTVKDHLKHIYQKVGTHQRTALLARFLGAGRT